MAFEYGESYFGLRSYGSSVGEVKDASATVTATSGSNPVAWAVGLGSGQITGTVASSSSCSGEVVIIEESDVFSYGMGSYGQNAYTQGDLQTTVTATASATASCLRKRTASATVTVSAAISVEARRIPEGSVLIEGSSTTTITTSSNGSRVRESSATSSPVTTITTSGFKTVKGTATVSAVASNTANAEFMVNASATVTPTVTSAAICNRVRFGSGVPTAVASITVLGYATRGGIASTGSTHVSTVTVQNVSGSNKYFINGVQQETQTLVEGNTYTFDWSDATAQDHPFRFSTTSDGTHGSGTEYTTGVTINNPSPYITTIVVADDAPVLYYYCEFHPSMGGATTTPNNSVNSSATSDSEKIFQGSIVLEALATNTATCNRMQSTSGVVSATSGTATIGREKWEIITNDSVTWTEIAA